MRTLVLVMVMTMMTMGLTESSQASQADTLPRRRLASRLRQRQTPEVRVETNNNSSLAGIIDVLLSSCQGVSDVELDVRGRDIEDRNAAREETIRQRAGARDDRQSRVHQVSSFL